MLISSKVNGATPLVISCRNGHSEIVEYLLTWCQADVEQVGSVSFDGEPIEDAPPLWCASAAGHLGIVKLLVRHGANNYCATYVDKKRDMVSALSLWRRAMKKRNQEPKIPKVINDPIAAYEGAHYADAGRFDRCIDLWTYALTMQQKILPPLSPMTQSSLLSFAELFSFMLMEAGRLLPRGRVVPPIEAQSWSVEQQKNATTSQSQNHHQQQRTPQQTQQQSTVVASSVHDYNQDPNALSRALVSALHIGRLLAWLTEDETSCPKMRREILVALYKLNRLNVAVRSGRTALHYACYREGTLVGRYPP
ncbi:Protein fem-1 homolog CG6966 [Eumeta japonica]|uniref:Protein fem-1 homolog CG6966 n=1 Tax=Eumeta variegata TaxID=151549 RepID=A0A4C1TEA5_EUMVA|nr:Protein fem-1 homolog CG6966 [Eumeta japonica]